MIGATIGSSIPKTQTLSSEPTSNEASVGQHVEIEERDGETLSGTYGGHYDERLWVENGNTSTSIRERDVKSARVKQDNYFLEGFLVGLALDATVLAVLAGRGGDFLPSLGDRHYHVGADGVEIKAR